MVCDLSKSQTIDIGKDGQVYLNSSVVTLEELSRKLIPIDRNFPILIRADRTLPLQDFVSVLDRIKSLGFSRVGLETEALHQ